MRIFKVVEHCPECFTELVHVKTIKEAGRIVDKIMKCPKCKVENPDTGQEIRALDFSVRPDLQELDPVGRRGRSRPGMEDRVHARRANGHSLRSNIWSESPAGLGESFLIAQD